VFEVNNENNKKSNGYR